MEYKGEIRQSTINTLLEKARDRKYEKYLSRITLKKVRGFVDEQVTFDFPVTAIIGPNGGGKTTVLGAAAILYKEIAPRQFFSKSGNYDSGMQDWSIEYEVVDRSVTAKGHFQRTASFKNKKWNRDALARRALLFGVARTVPASERKELIPCTARKFSVPPGRVTEFSDTIRGAISRILGKNVDGFKQLKVSATGTVTMLTGQTEDGVGYSEFHFGAGESSIIKMIAGIEAAEDGALVLIEEIENGLHPVATVRLVEYLIEVAERKDSSGFTNTLKAQFPIPLVCHKGSCFSGQVRCRIPSRYNWSN